MSKERIGNQTIACSVASCRYNNGDAFCGLSRIEVRPCSHCHSHTGDPEDESICGNYCSR